jgi:Peptidase family M48
MSDVGRQAEHLFPHSYHNAVVNYLKNSEPTVWAWASSLEVLEEHTSDLRALLLRETYRLTPESHAGAYAACHLVMQRLGINAPATLYQAGDGAMNASLYYMPGEVHVVLHGAVLERLNEQELIALLGHELSHYQLWSGHNGDFHTAERILKHTLADPSAAASHYETSRLYDLHTEMYADRGAAVAAGAVLPAISALVKVHTGLNSVDPLAYLQQAEELENADKGISKGLSHPESYLRAQALDKWWRNDDMLSSWLRKRLQGPLSMDRLDLSDQLELTALTRKFIARFLQQELLQSERVLTQVRGYFPDWSSNESIALAEEFGSDRIDDGVREYLNYVMLDLVLADAEIREPALLEAAKAARGMGSLDSFLVALKKDAGMHKRDLDKLARQLAKAADA